MSNSTNSIKSYVRELKMHLEKVSIPEENDNYLDLAAVTNPDKNALQNDYLLPERPLSQAFELILDELNARNLDKVKLGINELLKTYIKIVSEKGQEEETHAFLTRIKLIFRYSLLPSFPYANHLWHYICLCLQNTAFILLKDNKHKACKILLDYVATMGKSAAKEGLRTDILQYFLVMFELKARDNGLEELMGEAKNHRHNLEV